MNEIAKKEEMPVAINDAIAQLDAMKEFIGKVMKQDIDFMSMKGKNCLLKSGAEKLENLHKFTHTFECIDKVEDFAKGFFFYRYKCSVKDKNDRVVSECIGSANNKEQNRSGQDPFTTVNTIDKMAQKRAYVGAIIAACRVSSDFTQDLDDTPSVAVRERKDVTPKPGKMVCADCGAEISEAVYKFSTGKWNRPLCLPCQEEVKRQAQ